MTPDALTREEYLRRRYGGSQRLVGWLEARLLSRWLADLAPAPARVLDAPAGHGRFTPLLRAAAGAGVVAVDRDLGRLAALRQAEAAAGRASVAVAAADLLAGLPFAPGSFDLVFSLRFLHHVRAPEARRQVLAELARVSARWVVVSYYAGGTLHALQKAVQYRLGRRRRGRVAMAPPGELPAVAAALGCRVRADVAILPGLHAQRLMLLEV